MIDSLCLEIKSRKSYLKEKTLKSIYFGGGTPSLLSLREIQKILNAVCQHFTIESSAEITLEANPDDITATSVQGWRELGINRLSIGIQSFKAEDLKWMNRAHNVDEALKCVEIATKSGISSVSVDLIYGLPNLSNEEWVNHIERVLAMKVQHISAYCLTVEPKTALHNHVQVGKITIADEDTQQEQFLLLTNTLEMNGFHHYEISNFSLPGFEAVHNSNYWKGIHYLGIGPSAHSFDGFSRRWNVSNNMTYLNNITKESGWFEEEQLSAKDQWNEYVLTGLRTSTGINYEHLATLHEISENFFLSVDQLEKEGFLSVHGQQIVLTTSGKLQADRIAAELFL